MIVFETKALKKFLVDMIGPRIALEHVNEAAYNMLAVRQPPATLMALRNECGERLQAAVPDLDPGMRSIGLFDYMTRCLLGRYWRLDQDRLDWCFERMQAYSKVYKADSFKDDPYYRDIRFEKRDIGNGLELGYSRMFAYEPFAYSAAAFDPEYLIDVPALGCLDARLDYPCVRNISTGGEHINVMPNYITAAREETEKAHGKVLALGAGMGYFAYLASLNDNVESVTVMDANPLALEIFQGEILPLMPTKDEIYIESGAYLDYLENIEKSDYDYVFVDFWCGSSDLELYMKIKDIDRKKPEIEFAYWNESMHIRFLQQYLVMYSISVMMPDHPGPDNLSEVVDKRMLDYVAAITEDCAVKSPEDLKSLVSEENILKLMAERHVPF